MKLKLKLASPWKSWRMLNERKKAILSLNGYQEISEEYDGYFYAFTLWYLGSVLGLFGICQLLVWLL